MAALISPNSSLLFLLFSLSSCSCYDYRGEIIGGVEGLCPRQWDLRFFVLTALRRITKSKQGITTKLASKNINANFACDIIHMVHGRKLVLRFLERCWSVSKSGSLPTHVAHIQVQFVCTLISMPQTLETRTSKGSPLPIH
eukprot:g11430.t1